MKIRKNGKVINLTESDLQRIVKRVISEQQSTEGSTNITLTNSFKNSAQQPQRIESNTDAVSFPPATDGIGLEGNYAVVNGKGVITNLGGNRYLVMGSIGTLDGNNKVQNPEPKAMIIAASPFEGDGAGSPVRVYKPLSVNNLGSLSAQIAKIMDKTKSGEWYKNNANKLATTYKISAAYGIDTKLLGDQNTYNKEVNRYLVN